MRKILVIAAREYNAAVRAKSFLISLLLLPILMGGGFVMQRLLKNQVDITEKRFAIIDRTKGAQLYPLLEAAVAERNAKFIVDEKGKQIEPAFKIENVEPKGTTRAEIEQQRFEQSERIRRGEIFGFLEIGSDVFAIPKPRPLGSRNIEAGGRLDRIDAALEAEKENPNSV